MRAVLDDPVEAEPASCLRPTRQDGPIQFFNGVVGGLKLTVSRK